MVLQFLWSSMMRYKLLPLHPRQGNGKVSVLSGVQMLSTSLKLRNLGYALDAARRAMKRETIHAHYHWHEGRGHSHSHEDGHHSTPFRKPANVTHIGPDLVPELEASIEKVKAERDD